MVNSSDPNLTSYKSLLQTNPHYIQILTHFIKTIIKPYLLPLIIIKLLWSQSHFNTAGLPIPAPQFFHQLLSISLLDHKPEKRSQKTSPEHRSRMIKKMKMELEKRVKSRVKRSIHVNWCYNNENNMVVFVWFLCYLLSFPKIPHTSFSTKIGRAAEQDKNCKGANQIKI